MSSSPHADTFEVVFMDEVGNVLCVGSGTSRDAARTSAVTRAFRRLDSTALSTSPTDTSSGAIDTVEVFVVNKVGKVLATGEGSSREDAHEAAFANALRQLHATFEEAASSSSHSAPPLHAPIATVSRSDPPVPIDPSSLNGANNGESIVKKWPDVTVSEFKGYFRQFSATKYACIGGDGTGKLTLCLNLIVRMSLRYDSVTVLTDKATSKHFCGLPTARIGRVSDFVVSNNHSGLRRAIIVDGVPFGVRRGDLSNLLAKADYSGMDVFFCAKSFDELFTHDYRPDVVFITHGSSSDYIMSIYMMQCDAKRFDGGDHLFATYQGLAPSAGHAIAFIMGDETTWHYAYRDWNEIDIFPKRLLA